MLDDARFLCKYCLLNNRRDYFTSEQAHQLRSDSQTMHLFAYREPMNRFNKSSLQIITGILWLSSGLLVTLKHPIQTYNQTVNISEIMMEFQLSLQ